MLLERMDQGPPVELTRQVNSEQLCMCIVCVMIESDGVRIELI